MRFKRLLTYILVIPLLGGCASHFTYEEGKVNIVATTTMLGDLVKTIGGDRVNVKTLMGVGVNPHSYQSKASDTTAIQKADLVIVGGLHLEGRMGQVLSYLDPGKLLITGDSIPGENLIYVDGGAVDPHIWFDVRNWIDVAGAVIGKLSEYDEDHAAVYESLGVQYITELTVLDDYVRAKALELPENKRILVTAHDAFNYFGRAYGFSVHSIQGISTESEASIRDIQNLARLVKELDVKAIFVESSVPQATINSVIEASGSLGHHLTIGGELFSDSLGDGSQNAETYIKMVTYNINTIVEALV